MSLRLKSSAKLCLFKSSPFQRETKIPSLNASVCQPETESLLLTIMSEHMAINWLHETWNTMVREDCGCDRCDYGDIIFIAFKCV